MSVVKAIRSRIAWGLLGGIIVVEGHSPPRLWSALGFAAGYAVIFGILEAVLVVANKRWYSPLRWPRRRRGSGDTAE